MRFFLTGASGFVGSNFVNKLLDNGYEITALLRPTSKPRVLFNKKLKICRGFLTDDWSEEFKSCDVFVHCASEGVVTNHDNWEKCFNVNFIESNQIITNAFNSGIRKFVICGSCFEYGRSGDEYQKIPITAMLKPTTPYGFSKASASLFALNFAKKKNLKLVVPRFFHLYGNGDHKMRFWPRLVEAARTDSDFEMTLGNQLRNFSTVEFAASKLLDIAINIDRYPYGGVVTNVGSDSNMSLLSFAQSEWQRLKAKGNILNGVIPHRKNEVMSYVPEL